MADRYWVDDAVSGLWNDPDNWSAASGGAGGVGIPGAADKAIFDGSNVTDCRLDAAMNITELSALVGYTGTIDGATDDLNHAISGDCIMDCTRVDLGDGTWTIGGHFDNRDVTTFNGNNSTTKLTGTAKNYISSTSKALRNLTIDGGSYISTDGGGNGGVLTLINTASLSIASGKSHIVYSGGSIVVSATGTNTITGAGSLVLSNADVTTKGGVIDVAFLKLWYGDGLVPGTYESANVVFDGVSGAQTLTLPAGTYTFEGDVEFDSGSGTYTVANNTNNPNLVFRGNVAWTEPGTLNWTKGTGTITLSGATAGTQTIDFAGKDIEDLVVNDIGATKQFIGTIATDSFNLIAGTVDHNGQGFETVGDYSVDSGSNFTNTGMDGSTIVVGGNLLVRGNAGNNIAWNATAAWTLTVTGTANCFFVDAKNSDASGGTTIDADDTTCTDSGSNTNWDFIPLAGVAIPGFVSEYDAFDILGISAATTVTAATTKLTVTVTPGTGEDIYLFDVQGFYDDASTGVGIIYDGISEIGRFSMGDHVGEPWESEKGIKLSGNLVIFVPKGAAGKGHLSYSYKSAVKPTILPLRPRERGRGGWGVARR